MSQQVVSRIVCIGASAGGLEPIQDFFRNLPATRGAAYVLVQHLSPDFKSMMADLLGRTTDIPVRTIESGMAVEPDCIYLPPRGYNVTVTPRYFELQAQDRKVLNLGIDVFLDSLAKSFGERAVAVILSGSGSDGTRGVRSVREHGGIVLVQEPKTAQFDGMPRSALDAGVADAVLGPADLPLRVAEIVSGKVLSLDTADSKPFVRKVTDLASSGAGLDLSCYRESTLLRRIGRRMAVTGCDTPEAYLDLLRISSDEREAMVAEALISVTRFFRDTDAWDVLRREVLRPLIDSVDGELRAWVSACSSGEEAYTLAMILREEMEDAGREVPVRIFTTDVDPRSLQRASEGCYTESMMAEVSEERRRKFFVQEEKGFRVRRSVRQMLVLARHDLTDDAPLTRMHLVTCRNALIYMNPELQQQVLASLHYSLLPQGHLFLGSSEQLGEIDPNFRTVDRMAKIFQKIRDEPLVTKVSLTPRVMQRLETERRPDEVPPQSFLEAAFEGFLAGEGACCLAVRANGEVQHVVGDARRFLRPPRGKVDSSVEHLVRSELAVPITTAMMSCKRDRKPILYLGIRCAGDDPIVIDLKVVAGGDKREPELYTVLLREAESREALAPDSQLDDEVLRRVQDTEKELKVTRENLQATIEELETINEEQQATNEELLASNEELQSTNEELHSVNEELHTVNAEYQRTLQQQSEAREETENLIRATGLGTFFLEDDGEIRKFTVDVTSLVAASDQDVGRSLFDLSHQFSDKNLLERLVTAPRRQDVVEEEAATDDGRSFRVRRSPFLREGERDGIVLTFHDVTEARRSELQASALNARFEAFLEAAPMSLSIVDDRQRLETVSRATEEILGFGDQEVGKDVADLWNGSLDAERHMREVLETGQPARTQFRSAQGRLVRGLQFRIDRPGQPPEVGAIFEDATNEIEARERADANQRLLEKILEQSPIGLSLVDAQGVIVQSNPEAVRLGLHGGESLAESFEGWSWEDRGGTGRAATRDPLDDVLQHRRPALDATAIKTGKEAGSTQVVSVRLHSLDSASDGWVVALVDETEVAGVRAALDRERARLRAIVETSSSYIVVIGEDGTVLVANRAAVDMSGMAEGSSRESRSFTWLTDDREPILPSQRPFDRVLAGESLENETYLACTASGEELWYLVSARRSSAASDEIVNEAVDITELVQARMRSEESSTQLAAATEKLEQRNHLLEQFTSIVSHDLQEPLRTISNYTRLLERELGQVPGEAQELINILSDAAGRSKIMIRDLLDFLKADASEISGTASPAGAVEFVCGQLRGLIEEKEATLDVGELPEEVALEEQLLRSLFSNLLSNSLKYSEQGPTIEVRGEVRGDLARFTVTDDGIGIPSDQLEMVFEPFHRGYSKAEYEGTGMGLSICRRLLRTAGGSIHFEPVAQGAKAVFEVPLPSAGHLVQPTEPEMGEEEAKRAS